MGDPKYQPQAGHTSIQANLRYLPPVYSYCHQQIKDEGKRAKAC